MSTPEPRFEVPPEYAEVYERAYRQAYESSGGPTTEYDDDVVIPAQRHSGGRRVAVPRQRTGQRSGQRSGPAPRGGARRAGRPTSAPVPEPILEPVLEPEPEPEPARGRHGHRGVPRTGSTLFPLIAVAAVVLMLIAGAFVLGRVTAPGSSGSNRPAKVVVTTTAPPSPSPSATATSSPYAGPTVPLQPLTAGAGCTAAPGLNPQNQPVGYDASNVLDADPATAWRCDADPVGQVLSFTLPAGSRLASVGLVPGYAVTDPASGQDLYAENNRITQVEWTFGDGSSVVQDLSADTQDRSLRTLRIPETTTDRVSMKILAVAPGSSNATLVSTVAFQAAGQGVSP